MSGTQQIVILHATCTFEGHIVLFLTAGHCCFQVGILYIWVMSVHWPHNISFQSPDAWCHALRNDCT